MSAEDMTDRTVAPSRPAAAPARPRGLGRGLSALLGESMPDEPVAVRAPAAGEAAPVAGKSIQYIDITSISPHPEQPRRHFDDHALQELADSIGTRGVIQPIIVRPHGPGRYQLVAGERRWRAAQRAQLHQIPAIVRDLDEGETLEIALIENVQRQDLNPIEEAQAYSRLVAQFGHSQEALGKLVGKSRSHVANMMRLLDLPGSVLDFVRAGKLSMGHARALVGVENAAKIARQVVEKGLSVRQVEKLVQTAKGRGETREGRAAAPRSLVGDDADIQALEQHLGDILGMKVAIEHGRNGTGTLSLRYSTLDQLDMLCQRLSGETI